MAKRHVYIVMMHYFLGTRKPYVVGSRTHKVAAEKLAELHYKLRGGGYIPEIIDCTLDTDVVEVYKEYKSADHNIYHIKDIYDHTWEKT